MALPWVSERNREIAEDVQKLLTRNEWYTREELIQHAGGDIDSIAQILDILNREHSALRVRPPRNMFYAMWHGATPDTTHLGLHADEFAELPWELKKSYVKKYQALHERGVFKRPLWEGIAVHMVVNEHLFRIGLLQERPRPDEGFVYPCMWRAAMPPTRPENEPNTAPHTVFVMFLGRVPPAAFPPYAKCAAMNHDCGLTPVCAGIETNLNMTRANIPAGRASVSSTTFELLECTSKETMLDDARIDLLARAETFPLAVPFRPMRCGFSLLSGTCDGGVEE